MSDDCQRPHLGVEANLDAEDICCKSTREFKNPKCQGEEFKIHIALEGVFPWPPTELPLLFPLADVTEVIQGFSIREGSVVARDLASIATAAESLENQGLFGKARSELKAALHPKLFGKHAELCRIDDVSAESHEMVTGRPRVKLLVMCAIPCENDTNMCTKDFRAGISLSIGAASISSWHVGNSVRIYFGIRTLRSENCGMLSCKSEISIVQRNKQPNWWDV